MLFFLVSIPLAFLFAVIEAVRHFVFGTKLPSLRDIGWMVGIYVAIWILADLTERLASSHNRLDEMESRLIEIEKRIGIAK